MSEKSKGKRLLDFRLLRRVFQYAKPYRKKFYISLVLAIVLAVLSPVRPYLIQLTINDFIKLGKIDW
ncbi:MAG: ABC transporter ATP-binding protein, partial [Chitinophagaceae bacterium]